MWTTWEPSNVTAPPSTGPWCATKEPQYQQCQPTVSKYGQRTGLEESLDGTVPPYASAEQFNQKHSAAQGNMCLFPNTHDLATQLTFHFKGSFSRINWHLQNSFPNQEAMSIFLKMFPPTISQGHHSGCGYSPANVSACCCHR